VVSGETSSSAEEISAELSLALKSGCPATETVSGSTRMRRWVERSNDTERLPLRPFCRDSIIAMRGYDFRKGHRSTCAGPYNPTCDIIMNRGLIALLKTLPSIGRSRASVPSSHDRYSVGFTTDIAESDFRYTQRSFLCAVHPHSASARAPPVSAGREVPPLSSEAARTRDSNG
jgi:hypothetical protein